MENNYSKTQQIIAKRLKEKREENGFTLDDVAKNINVSKVTLHKYENLVILNIPIDNIEKLAKLYHTSPSYIMGWTDDDNIGRSKMDGLDIMTYNSYVKIINASDRIKAIRENNDFTKSQFAAILNLTIDEIEEYENGTLELSLNTIHLIEKIFHVPKEVWLIGTGISEETKLLIKKICEEQEKEKEENIFNDIISILKHDGYNIEVYNEGKNEEFWRITSFDLPVDILNIKKKDLVNIALSTRRSLIDILISYGAGYSRSLFTNTKLKF